MAGVMASRDPLTYPENLDAQSFWSYNLADYRKRLDVESGRALQSDPNGAVDILTFDAGQSKFVRTTKHTIPGMIEALSIWRKPQTTSRPPRCQYVSIHAPSSRKKLRITKGMLQALFSQYGTMPSMLDFVFTFGRHSQKENFSISSFRTEEFFAPSFSYQLCYNLRNVESVPDPPDWPWSIRQAAISHSFDLESGDATWILIKGNNDMSKRFDKVTAIGAPLDPTTLLNAEAAFKASLIAHLVVCEWSRENWGRYVGFLEDRLQNKTRFALLATVNHPTAEQEAPEDLRMQHTDTMTVLKPVAKSLTWADRGKVVGSRVKSWVIPSNKVKPVPEIEDVNMNALPEKKNDHPEYKDFSYDDLRKIQFVEDQANKCLLAVKSNTSILEDLKGYYGGLQKSTEYQIKFGAGCDAALSRFYARITSVISDLRHQQSRLETLLRLIADRKALLFGLFEHRNMSTNKLLAMESRESAMKMQDLNIQMKDIATTTESETIVMRIVTFVTLIFLPGTFVATLMSTDIVKFQDNGQLEHQFSWPAFLTYFCLTIPIMVVTLFLAFRFMKKAKEETLRRRSGTTS